MNELDKLKKIREECSFCEGRGYIPKKMLNCIRLEECKCVKKIAWEIKLIEANIPEKYKTWDFRRLDKTFKTNNEKQYAYLRKYLDNLEGNIKAKNSFWLSSPPGMAKSSIITYFLREGLKLNFVGYYTKAAYLLTKKFEAMRDIEAKEFIDFLIGETDILVIEELEKVYLLGDTDIPNQLFYELLSDLYDSNKVLFLSSNLSKKETYKRFPSFIQDRLETIDYLPLIGKRSGRSIFEN